MANRDSLACELACPLGGSSTRSSTCGHQGAPCLLHDRVPQGLLAWGSPASQQVDLVQVPGQHRVPHVLEHAADAMRVRGTGEVCEEAARAGALPATVLGLCAVRVHARVHVQDEALGGLCVPPGSCREGVGSDGLRFVAQASLKLPT